MKNVLKQLGKVVCYYLLFLGMQFGVAYAMLTIYMTGAMMDGMFSGGSYDIEAVSKTASDLLMENINLMAAVSGVLTILVLWIFFLIRKKKLTQETGMTKLSRSTIVYMFLLGIDLAITVSFGLALLPESWLEAYAEQSAMAAEGPLLLMIFSTMIVAPIVEEMIFRGLMLSRLRKALPVGWAIVIVSLLFGLAHGQILWIAYTFVLGIILALVVMKTESLTASILLHMTFNIFGTVVPVLCEEIDSTVACVVIALCGLASTAYLLVSYMKAGKQDNV